MPSPWQVRIELAGNWQGTSRAPYSFLSARNDEDWKSVDVLGTVEEIWRYPVSSLGGERLMSVELSSQGIAGDRGWGIVDVESRQTAAPEKEVRWRPALFLNARMAGDVPEIGFPDGDWLSVFGNSIGVRLSDHFGFEVAAWPYGVPDMEHGGDEHVATNRYEPSPLHLLTTNALEHLSTLVGTETVESRRFRPNIVLKMHGPAGFCETDWLGQSLQIGSALVGVREETKRCGMTLIPQPDLEENANILRSILRQNRRNFGVYGSVDSLGTVSIGDGVDLVGA